MSKWNECEYKMQRKKEWNAKQNSAKKSNELTTSRQHISRRATTNCKTSVQCSSSHDDYEAVATWCRQLRKYWVSRHSCTLHTKLMARTKQLKCNLNSSGAHDESSSYGRRCCEMRESQCSSLTAATKIIIRWLHWRRPTSVRTTRWGHDTRTGTQLHCWP